MATYGAGVQFRTTFDQAGQIAGLAGELGISESDVWRRLVSWALDRGSKQVLRELRRELATEQAETERAIAEHERQEHDELEHRR